MPLNFDHARPLLQSGDFARLFREELGWEPAAQRLVQRIDGADYALTAFAEKRGFTAWLCECPPGSLPVHATRVKLERKLAETSYEHLLVFATPDGDVQSWMWVRRETGRPLAVRTHDYSRHQPGDSLLQKLDALFISLEDEEAGITVAEVAGRARAAFDVERVTKTFYREFDTHRKAFVKFIDGIGIVADREWYASVMLNRLMFVYFIQRKGFLDDDRDYLRHRLQRCREERGRDQFYSFYRYFLLRLFQEGFGRRRRERSAELERLLGNIPYLNGGLFDVHELERPERYGKDIQIPDQAFERIFDYFDRWQWHLDERPLRRDDEINPDVLGYIFEKYINQKQMGAYYTKEDITDYIGKNTLLPFLLDAARARCQVAFENPGGPTVWDQLRERPDRYIYAPMRHGTDLPLPPEIERGVSPPSLKDPVADVKSVDEVATLRLRKVWAKPAPPEYALPTEIWREVVARRQRCAELRRQLAVGEVREVNDLITLNLDIRQFVQDVIAQCEGPDLLRAIWRALVRVTVLDPTCGSGAFLFAALNLLEPLYEACLDRMEAFLGDLERSGEKHRPEKFSDFRAVLERVKAHPNRRYFVFKSIILQNLYGVDLMEEAVEICKLRLFLKLAAQVSPDPAQDNLGIEPLPDIDFNIRAGNTLVGYATYAEVEKAVTSTLDFDQAMQKIATRAADLQQVFDAFRQRQVEGDGSVPAGDKRELQKRLSALREELNRHLAGDYGVNLRDKVAYARWAVSHQPFHWFVEFYGILQAGGFDVIIGNPPYLEVREIDYSVKSYASLGSGAVHAMCVERSTVLLRQRGWLSMIVPLSLPSTQRMRVVQQLLEDGRDAWYANYAWRPAKLFDTVNRALTIFVVGPTTHRCTFSTNYQKWTSNSREKLFERLRFSGVPRSRPACWVPKLGETIESAILARCSLAGPGIKMLLSESDHRIYYRTTGGLYWKVFTDFPPMFFLNGKKGHSSRETWITVRAKSHVCPAIAALSSSLFWWWYTITSNVRDLNPFDIQHFPLPLTAFADAKLCELGGRYLHDIDRNSTMLVREQKQTGTAKTQSFKIQESKPIIDEIDTVLARHYGFTEEELDFIIHYDLKYRLGRDENDEE
jgi:hypothetical protein